MEMNYLLYSFLCCTNVNSDNDFIGFIENWQHRLSFGNNVSFMESLCPLS
jgi:hypothetical protein